MFKTLPSGVEVYFSWPSRTARVVPNRAVRHGIALRDNALRAIVALMLLSATLLQEKSTAVSIVLFLLAVAAFAERARYLAKLAKRPLELDTGDEPAEGSRDTAKEKAVRVTTGDVDRAYIADLSMLDGVLLTLAGLFLTAGSTYLWFTEVPLVIALALTFAGALVVYAGIRVCAGRWALRPRKRSKTRKRRA